MTTSSQFIIVSEGIGKRKIWRLWKKRHRYYQKRERWTLNHQSPPKKVKKKTDTKLFPFFGWRHPLFFFYFFTTQSDWTRALLTGVTSPDHAQQRRLLCGPFKRTSWCHPRTTTSSSSAFMRRMKWRGRCPSADGSLVSHFSFIRLYGDLFGSRPSTYAADVDAGQSKRCWWSRRAKSIDRRPATSSAEEKEKKTWAAIFDVYVVRHLAVLECRECVDPSTRRCARVIIPFFFFFWKVVCSRAPSCAQHAVRQRWTLLLFPSTAHRQWDGGRQLHRDWWPCHDGHHHGVRVPYRSAPKRSFHKKIYIFFRILTSNVSLVAWHFHHTAKKKNF